MAKILIVDDRPSNRQFLTTLLAYGGHRMMEAANGIEALGLVRSRRPDLVITDILMPTMDGYEFVQTMRADPAVAGTRVIFYTATYSAPQAEELAKTCGVQKVLAKPSEPQAILTAVSQALGIREPGAAPPRARGEAAAPSADDTMSLFAKDLESARLGFESVLRDAQPRAGRDAIRDLSAKFAENVVGMQRLTARLSALIEVGMEMMTERDPARLVELFFAAACDLIASDYAAIGMLDSAEREVRHVYAKGFDAAILQGEAARKGLLQTLLSGRSVLRAPDANAAAGARGLPSGHPEVRDLLGLPVSSGGRTYGWVYFAGKRGQGGFSDEDARVANVMTRKLALSYENAMLYDALQRRAAELQIEAAVRKDAVQALREREAGLRRAQIMASLSHVITGADGAFETWSESLPALLGVEPARMPRSTRAWLELVHPDDRALFRGNAIDARAQGARVELEYRLRRADGSWSRIRQVIEPIEGSADAAHGMRWFNTLQDVTAQRRTEESLRDSEARFRQMAESIRDVFFLLDAASGRTLYLSPAFEEVWGRTRESVYADTDTWTDTIHPDDRAATYESYRKGMETGRFEYGYRIVRPDGSVRWISARGFPVRDEAGSLFRIAGVAEDVTERKRVADELRESDRRFRDMLGKVELVSLMLDDQARIMYCNDYLLRLTGWRRDEVEGRDWFELFIPPDAQELDKVFADLLADLPRAWHHENEILTKSGARRLVRWSNSVLRSSSGGVIGTASIGEDITEQKQADIKIRGLNRVHAVLSGINALIVRVRDRDELCREACRIAVEQGRFKMAWIGLVDCGAMKLVPIASAGAEAEFLALIKERFSLREDDPMGNTMTARAIREKKPVVINEIRDDTKILFAKERLERGIASMAILPLLVSDQAVGVLALYSGETGFFDDDEMKLLRELAGDISFALEHIDKAEKLDYLAYYDALTGLANQSLFLERLEEKLLSARTEHLKKAVFVLDIERFKAINDAFGRQAGDELLKQIAQRLVEVGAGDASRFARVGADRFAAVAAFDMDSLDQIGRYTEQRMDATFRGAFRVGEQELRVAAKIGIALFPDDGEDAETLLRNAEAALKKAKATGERYLYFTQAMTERNAERVSLESKLRQALEKEEFVLHYQPKVDLDRRAVVGLEALIRWQSPEQGLVAPKQFIPLLEETGLILEVGSWALKRAALDHRGWVEQKLKAPRIAVNVSQIQLRQRNFVEMVQRAVAEGVAPPGIDLEITESLVMEEIQANIEKLKAIRALGMSIAIDDFGTGYSSLAYLALLPVETLKIDRAFVVKMTENPDAATLVQTMISLAHSLRLQVVAEGVETEEQAKMLRLLRCDQMQGFLFSRPLPLAGITALLRAAPDAAGR